MTRLLLNHFNLWSRSISRGMMLDWFVTTNTTCVKYLNWILSLIGCRSYHILPLIGFESVRGLGRRYHHHWLGRKCVLHRRILSSVVDVACQSANTMGCLVSRGKCSRCMLDICLLRLFPTKITFAFNCCAIFLSLWDIKHHVCVNCAHMCTVLELLARRTTCPSATSQGHSLL